MPAPPAPLDLDGALLPPGEAKAFFPADPPEDEAAEVAFTPPFGEGAFEELASSLFPLDLVAAGLLAPELGTPDFSPAPFFEEALDPARPEEDEEEDFDFP